MLKGRRNKRFINLIVVTIGMPKKATGEYKAELRLDSSADLEMLIFNDKEHRWIFRHRYTHPENRERLEKPTLVNDTRLVVNYGCGIAKDCNLFMDIVRPDRRGKEYIYGVDISKGSRLILEFVYEKQDDLFRMKTLIVGAGKRVDLDSFGEGLVKPVDFPFPLKDRLESESGVYKVPFLKGNGEQAFFEFPQVYRRQLYDILL